MMGAPDARLCPKRRILVIDDEPDMCDLMEEALSSVGYDVSTVEDGATAVELAKGEAFDLAITDQRMPGMSGIDTLSRLKQIDPDLPVIVLASYVSDEAARRLREDGAARIVDKPVSLADLLRAVEVAIRKTGT